MYRVGAYCNYLLYPLNGVKYGGAKAVSDFAVLNLIHRCPRGTP